jgi:hypothetical protein
VLGPGRPIALQALRLSDDPTQGDFWILKMSLAPARKNRLKTLFGTHCLAGH